MDREVLGCLARNGAMSPAEIACELGMSEGEATALVAGLAREGRVRIAEVELAECAVAAVAARPAAPTAAELAV